MAADKKEAKKAANSLFQLGNSAEVIAQLEKDYDFSGVGVKEHEQARNGTWRHSLPARMDRMFCPPTICG